MSSDHILRNGSLQTASVISAQDAMTGVNRQKYRCDYRWSKKARDLVRDNRDVSGRSLTVLITNLVQLTGYPRWACLRFAKRMGVRSRKRLKPWTTQEQQRLLKLIDLHPIKEVANMMRRTESSVWHMLYRLGANAQMGKDCFTKYTLAVALHVRPETIEEWIKRGWLEAREIGAGNGKRTIIDGDAFCHFCKQHVKDVIGNRLSKERLEFVYHYVFPANHSELLPVRASKKERNAYEDQIRQEQGDEEQHSAGLKESESTGNDDARVLRLTA